MNRLQVLILCYTCLAMFSCGGNSTSETGTPGAASATTFSNTSSNTTPSAKTIAGTFAGDHPITTDCRYPFRTLVAIDSADRKNFTGTFILHQTMVPQSFDIAAEITGTFAPVTGSTVLYAPVQVGNVKKSFGTLQYLRVDLAYDTQTDKMHSSVSYHWDQGDLTSYSPFGVATELTRQ